MRSVQSACHSHSVHTIASHSVPLSTKSASTGINTIPGVKCRLNLAVLLTGLLTASLAGCATTGTGMYANSQCGARTTGACAVPSGGNDGGCRIGRKDTELTACQLTAACDVPRELRKTSLPEYRIEIPDILLIEAVHNLRPSTALIHAGEPLLVQVNRTVPVTQLENRVEQQFKQINGIYVIGTDGYLNLGPEYGKILVAEQSLGEIQRRVESHLQRILTDPQVLVTLPNPQNEQVVAGQHLVRMDGTVGLGVYGSVHVNGMTRQQARCAIERHLARHIHNPQVSLDVLAYNSKKYYVVFDGGGFGEQVVTLPSTGNETVLDAIATIQGLPGVASKANIWVARPAPGCSCDQVLPVDWNAIVQGAQTETNYQVLPGDRIYVKADHMMKFNICFAKMTAPIERLLGFTLLGNGTYQTLSIGQQAFINGN